MVFISSLYDTIFSQNVSEVFSAITILPLPVACLWVNSSTPTFVLCIDGLTDLIHSATHLFGESRQEWWYLARYFTNSMTISAFLCSIQEKNSPPRIKYGTIIALLQSFCGGVYGTLAYYFGGVLFWVAFVSLPINATSAFVALRDPKIDLNKNIIIILFVSALTFLFLDVVDHHWQYKGVTYVNPDATLMSRRDIFHGMAHASYEIGKYYVLSRVFSIRVLK